MMKVGTMKPAAALMLRVQVGNAEEQDGENYEVVLINGVVPAVRSEKTGKTFILSWEDICNMARLAGINEACDREIRVVVADDNSEEGTEVG